MKTFQRSSVIVGLTIAFTVLLAGCAAEPAPQTSLEAEVSPEEHVSAAPIEAVTQDATCDWETAPAEWSGDLPTGQEGELSEVLIGAWQHASYDSGEGFAPISPEDIRYVFPTDGGLLYCQHVEGITEYAENAAAMTLDGTLISPPSPHPGFNVTAWDSNTMVWLNNTDGSSYVLVRR